MKFEDLIFNNPFAPTPSFVGFFPDEVQHAYAEGVAEAQQTFIHTVQEQASSIGVNIGQPAGGAGGGMSMTMILILVLALLILM